MNEKEIVVEEIPAGPGWYAWTRDYEERYGTTWGRTPEEARENHLGWMEMIDDEE